MPKIKANNLNLYYELHGTGKPLILISGLATSHFIWLPLIEKLKSENQILIFDNRGIGESDNPNQPYSIEDMADDVFALMQNLNLEKPHILGSSMGGAIAQMLAINHGDKIDRLILDSTTAKLNFSACLASDFILSLYKIKMPLEQKALGFIPWLFGSDYLEKKENFQKVIKDFLSNASFPTEVGFKRHLEALKKFDSRNLLEKIQNPTLILRGEKDILIPGDETEVLFQNIPDASFYAFKKTGHSICIEKPDSYAKIVLDFINEKIFKPS